MIIRKNFGYKNEKIKLKSGQVRIKKVPIFKYYDDSSKKENNDSLFKQRVSRLRIPPNWSDVKISKNPSDYVQVLAKDEKNRTQYIYHPLFVELTNREKYLRLREFINKLPKFIREINESLSKPKDEKEYLIAIMFRIMMLTHSRVGNDIHEDSFGLTTLEKKHVKIEGSSIYFSFKGKKGVQQNYKISDKYVKDTIQILLKQRGNRLFKCKNGSIIRSIDMNNYLKTKMGNEFSCKDFRTYASNYLFIEIIKQFDIPKTKKEIKENLKQTFYGVARELGHTKQISKASYVIPQVPIKYEQDPEYFNQKNIDKILTDLI